MARPFVARGAAWEWALRDEADFEGAIVNAKFLGVDEGGARLARQGKRPISLISPALDLPANSNRILKIEASLEKAEQPAARLTIRLLWQTEGGDSYRFIDEAVDASGGTAHAWISLPVAPDGLQRIGVQFPDAPGPVRVRSIGLPDLGQGERLAVFCRQALSAEPIQNHSMNFLRGPNILGHGLNYYLVWGSITGMGGYGVLCVLRRRRIRPLASALILLAIWMLGDAQSSASLGREVVHEAAAFGGIERWDRLALAEGKEIAAAYRMLLEHAQEGTTFSVVSDDTFWPAHRLAYLAAPWRRLMAGYESADLIAVVSAREAVFDEAAGHFSWKGGPNVEATMVAGRGEGTYLLRRGSR